MATPPRWGLRRQLPVLHDDSGRHQRRRARRHDQRRREHVRRTTQHQQGADPARPERQHQPEHGRVAEAIIIPTASDPLNPSFGGPIVVTFAVSGITFKGFTVDGDNPSLTSGVAFNGSDVDAEFGVYGDGSANLDAVIENNIVKNVGEIAVWLNTFGIGGARNGNSRMTANKVDNVLGAFGQALRISDDAWVDVTNNVVTRSRVGIVIENFSGNVTTHPASVIADNNITTFRIGIRHNLHYVYNAPGFTIKRNTVQPYVQSPLPPQVSAPTAYRVSASNQFNRLSSSLLKTTLSTATARRWPPPGTRATKD